MTHPNLSAVQAHLLAYRALVDATHVPPVDLAQATPAEREAYISALNARDQRRVDEAPTRHARLWDAWDALIAELRRVYTLTDEQHAALVGWLEDRGVRPAVQVLPCDETLPDPAWYAAAYGTLAVAWTGALPEDGPGVTLAQAYGAVMPDPARGGTRSVQAMRLDLAEYAKMLSNAATADAAKPDDVADQMEPYERRRLLSDYRAWDAQRAFTAEQASSAQAETARVRQEVYARLCACFPTLSAAQQGHLFTAAEQCQREAFPYVDLHAFVQVYRSLARLFGPVDDAAWADLTRPDPRARPRVDAWPPTPKDPCPF